jgi:hypothetical protein
MDEKPFDDLTIEADRYAGVDTAVCEPSAELADVAGLDERLEAVRDCHPEEPKFDQERWAERGGELAKQDNDVRWQIGEWLIEGRLGLPFIEFPDGPNLPGINFYSYASDITGLAVGTLKDLASTADRFDPSARTDKVTWSHHRVIINELPDEPKEELQKWLKTAEDEHLTTRELQKAIRGKQKEGEGKGGDKRLYKTFRVKVLLEVYETLDDLSNGDPPTSLQKVAADILTDHCKDESVQIMREWAKKQWATRVHDARSKNGIKVARNYNPLRLDRS